MVVVVVIATSNNSGNTTPVTSSIIDLFQAVFRHTPIPMAIITMNGHFVAVNHAFVQMLGHSSEEQFKDKECSLFTLQRFGEKVFLHQLLQATGNGQNNTPGMITRMDDSPSFVQKFLHKNGKLVVASNTASVIENVFGVESKLFLHTVTQFHYL